MDNIDITKIKETISILKPADQLYEIRILRPGKKPALSGYFRGVENLEAKLKTVDLRGCNIFYTLNTIDDACYAREQNEKFREGVTTTSDNDITGYNWLLVDMDPKRRTGVSSTDEELTKAKRMAEKVVRYLRGCHFQEPIIALSGNGVHLLYAIKLKNVPENVDLLKRCLEALAYTFNDDYVEIDCKVFNPARISKLYGTMAQKGTSTKDRPHRMSRIVRVPKEIRLTDREYMEGLAALVPKEEPQKRTKAPAAEFDLDTWIQEHGIRVQSVKQWNGCTKYILEECAFDSSHKAPDACLLKMPSGALAYKCLHNSCNGRKWQDFRLLYEPDAYDDEDDGHIERGFAEYMKYNRNRTDVNYAPLPEVTPDEPLFMTPLQILARPNEEKVLLNTGIEILDKKLGGLAKTEISVVSGLRGSGKSTILSQIALQAIQQDFRCIVYSGELKSSRFFDWMAMQAAGYDYLKKSQKYDNAFYIEKHIKEKVANWIGDRLKLYNNNHGNSFKQIATELRQQIKTDSADFVIIDNMMCLDLSEMSPGYGPDKFEQQTNFVKMLKNIAVECNVHIIFVAHPRKSQGFLRLDDIAGSGNITNLVDNAFIFHRVNEDFTRLTKAMYHWKDTNEVYQGTNVLEICKDRENGTQDLFIPLWFERGTRRIFNHEGEHLTFGWCSEGEFAEVNDVDLIPPWEA